MQAGRLVTCHSSLVTVLKRSGSSLFTRHSSLSFSLPGPEGKGGMHLSLVLLGADALLAKVDVFAPAAAG